MSRPVKALVVGALNGKLQTAFGKINSINAKHGPFDLVLCVGDFFGSSETTSADVQGVLSGSLKVPLPTYIITGREKLPAEALNNASSNFGEIAEQLVYLGASGIYSTAEGLKIAYLSGSSGPAESARSERFSEGTVQALCGKAPGVALGVDILITTEWAEGILNGSPAGAKVSEGQAKGTNAITEVAVALQPRYHFAAGGFFEREPYRNRGGARHVTRFIAVGDFEPANKKQRWFYAMNIVPMSKIDLVQLAAVPPNTTPLPFSSAAADGGRKRPADEMSDSFFFNSTSSDGGRNKRHQGERKPPPSTYICHKCNEPGHWVQDCPQGGRGAPPAEYDCPEKQQRPAELLKKREAGQCWFCLSNPQVEKHLIVSIGNEVYLTLAKGGLVDWGGHFLLVPIAHNTSTRQMQTLEGEEGESAQNALKEMEGIKEKIRELYKARGDVMVCFEMFGGGAEGALADTLQHMHLQVVPMSDKSLPELETAFMKEAEEEGLELIPNANLPDLESDMYCRVELPTSSSTPSETKILVFRPSPDRMEEYQQQVAEAEQAGRRHPPRIMNLQFGRKVLAELMGVPHAADWKRMLLPKEDEEKLTGKIRELIDLDA
ncbi:CwfJ C-terminus 1-domain-containing protein-like protein [Fimicolochytrium jonesii]|uniref:CwfJ C-terminus 1-domain-containing protein-like protein n=1 Tax=Fimicolochytrium jonesii TaxID=1396493 RepID=UPI0022FE7A0B|nr:CwfJ C-terminus 1-domain-containing protein-like protein [Fimicolochytrium jonesii]KAI8822915.1 CwfJ C-terminus 1-domain-containing protein-like protein [Fimicolochytrium jonesii]